MAALPPNQARQRRLHQNPRGPPRRQPRHRRHQATAAAPGFAATNLQATSNETGGMSGAMWTRRFAQSAENGTMPLLMVSFSEGVGNEEFWEPKGAIKGIAVNVDWDKVSTSEEAAKILWEKSEEAVGEFKI
mmetsp:Transcript_12791/g.33848  ORF Transcript_12791/g.33848 Transcript_12791/m.33848 type:complete len:132 (+) Transcript_12791:692-1087(+)